MKIAFFFQTQIRRALVYGESNAASPCLTPLAADIRFTYEQPKHNKLISKGEESVGNRGSSATNNFLYISKMFEGINIKGDFF